MEYPADASTKPPTANARIGAYANNITSLALLGATAEARVGSVGSASNPVRILPARGPQNYWMQMKSQAG